MTRFTVNGHEVSVEALPMARLLDVLREDLRLTLEPRKAAVRESAVRAPFSSTASRSTAASFRSPRPTVP